MTQPTGTMRKLQYPLNTTEDIESDVGDSDIAVIDLDGWSTEDADERVNVVLNLSLNEYVALASVIDVGRDIAYGDNSIYIWWLWVRSILTLDICDAINQCILTNEETQNLIAQYGVGNTPSEDSGESTTNLARQIITDRIGCDDDIIFGMCGGLVDFLDSISRRILSAFQSAVSPAGRIGDMIESIPLVGELPVDDVFQFSEAMMNDIAGGYDGAYDVTVRNDIACKLFCLALEDCELSMEDARDIYQQLFAQSIDTSNVLNFFISMIGNIYSGEATVYGLHLLILEVMIFGGRIDFIDVDRFANTVLAMFNDPDSDWDILCDDCAEWVQNFDFTIDQQGWSFVANRGSYVAGVGFRSLKFANNETANYIYNDLLNESEVTEMTVTGSFTGDTTVTFRSATAMYYDAVQDLASYESYTPPNAPTNLTWLTDQVNYGLRWQLYLTGFTSSNPPIHTATSMVIKGKGTNPFL